MFNEWNRLPWLTYNDARRFELPEKTDLKNKSVLLHVHTYRDMTDNEKSYNKNSFYTAEM